MKKKINNSLAEIELPKVGKYKTYQFVGYWNDDNLIDSFAPINDFNIERMLVNIHFVNPVNGKFNIDYPFRNVIFQCAVTNANSLGDILTQISKAYKRVYELVLDSNIEYLHVIDDLVLDDEIRIFENGTIEFSISS